MLQAINSLKGFAHSNRRSTETVVFYLHCHITVLMLFFCSVLVWAQHFSAHRIQCTSHHSNDISKELLNEYCWAASTYSVSSSYLEESGVYGPHPGVLSSEKEDEYEYRNFYQYVHIVLFIQAILFYVPHFIWKNMEGLFLTKVSGTIVKKKGNTNSKDEVTASPDDVAAYITEKWGCHKLLTLKYIFCEGLSATNVLVQSYFLHIFFHGRFLGLGLLVEAYYRSSILNDPVQLFPLVTICAFRRYGASGHIDVIDSLCVLPNNALNAKIFICMWIWFLILLVLSSISLVHFIVCLSVPIYRVLNLKIKYIFFSNNIEHDIYMKLISLGDYGDWFVLSSIKEKMDEFDFSRLMERVYARLISLESETEEA